MSTYNMATDVTMVRGCKIILKKYEHRIYTAYVTSHCEGDLKSGIIWTSLRVQSLLSRLFSTFLQADKNITPMLHVTGPLVVDSLGASAEFPSSLVYSPILKTYSWNKCNRLHPWAFHVKLLSGKCQKHPSWQINNGAGNGLVPSVIIRANVDPDLCTLTASY